MIQTVGRRCILHRSVDTSTLQRCSSSTEQTLMAGTTNRRLPWTTPHRLMTHHSMPGSSPHLSLSYRSLPHGSTPYGSLPHCLDTAFLSSVVPWYLLGMTKAGPHSI